VPAPKARQAVAKAVPVAKTPAPPEPKEKPEPKVEPKVASVPPKPEPPPKTPAPVQKPVPDIQPIPKAPASPEKAPTAPARKEPPRPRPQESDEERLAQTMARLREKRTSPEAQVSDKVASLRKRLVQGSEQQVSDHIAELREKFGTREPGHGSGATSTGAGGALGVSGGGGAGLQGFLESRYIQTVREHLNLYWSVTETLKGKGYEAFVSVIVDRRGKIVNWSVRRSGNRLFDEKVERAVAEADPLPPVPNGMAGERFEFELRFSAP
jgi:TonB family protein